MLMRKIIEVMIKCNLLWTEIKKKRMDKDTNRTLKYCVLSITIWVELLVCLHIMQDTGVSFPPREQINATIG